MKVRDFKVLALSSRDDWATKNTVPVLHSIMYSFKEWQNNKNHAFPSKRCISNEKPCYCYTFYNEKHSTYLYITCNKKIFLLKSTLAYCGYSQSSTFFLMLSEHRHCDNAATNWNSGNARSRIVASLRGSVGTGTEEGELSTWRFWAAGFHSVTSRSLMARVFELMNSLIL
jgi:hypothetical protein